MKLRVSRRARADLDSIWLYVCNRDGAERAQRLVESITDKFRSLPRNRVLGGARRPQTGVAKHTRGGLPYLL